MYELRYYQPENRWYITNLEISRTGVSNTRATCGPREHFVRHAMVFENVQMINI